MQLQKANFAKHGTAFQYDLVKLLILDKTFCDQIAEILDHSFFELETLRVLSKNLFEYKDKYKIHPSIPTLETIMNTQTKLDNAALYSQIKSFLFDLKENQEIRDEEFVKTTSIEFCRKQKIKEALFLSFNDLEKDNFDLAYAKIEASFKLGLDNKIGHDYQEDIEVRYRSDVREVIPTPWERINEITKGGVSKKEVHAYIACTGGGKSSALVNLAAGALTHNKNVVYYTFENPEYDIGQRFDACISGVRMDELHLYKDEIKHHLGKIPGKLIIKEYPMYSINIRTIENHVRKLRSKGISIDLVILDYVDLMLPSDNSSGLDAEAKVFADFVSFCQRENVAGVTAAQANREGVDAEVLTLKHIQGAYKKYGPVHFALTMSPYGNAYIAKNRNGKSDIIFQLVKDLDRMQIDIRADYVPGAEEDPGKAITSDIKSQLKSFLEKQKKR
jgi:hypothetical protein